MAEAGNAWFAGLAAALLTADPAAKVDAVLALGLPSDADIGQADGTGDLTFGPDPWPDPATRARPPLLPPADMPRRRLGSAQGRIALLHAVAHIELNAIDLALDIIGRFAREVAEPMRVAFVADWLAVAKDEARHFALVDARLHALGAVYGDLPAHAALWEAATRTSGDLLARLAIAPLVLEARGLDVTPEMVRRLEAASDLQSAGVLRTILDDEIGHVATGYSWFCRHAAALGHEPELAFGELVRTHYPAGLKGPFNHGARAAAGVPRAWYEGLAVG